MCALGQIKYVLITAGDGGIINEPVPLLVGKNRPSLALPDSHAGLRARGYTVRCGLDMTVREPETRPARVQDTQPSATKSP